MCRGLGVMEQMTLIRSRPVGPEAAGSRGCCPGLRRDSGHRLAADRQPETKFQTPV